MNLVVVVLVVVISFSSLPLLFVLGILAATKLYNFELGLTIFSNRLKKKVIEKKTHEVVPVISKCTRLKA